MKLILGVFGWVGRLIVVLILLAAMTNCTRLGLNYASLNVDGKPQAWPAIADDPEEFLAEREMWKERLETHIFGPFPEGVDAALLSHTVIDDQYLGGLGSLEEFVIEISGNGKTRAFTLGIALPKSEAPVPVIISQSFCGNQTAFRYPAMSPPIDQSVDDFCGGGEPSMYVRT